MTKHSVIKNFSELENDAQLLLRILMRIRKGSLLITFPNGETLACGESNEHPPIQLDIKDWKMAKLILSTGDIGAAESYIEGHWSTNDLSNLLILIASNKDNLKEAVHGSRFKLLTYFFKDLFRINTIKGAKRNIRQHYDLGNNFYEAWLDESMTYSSAIFPKDNIEKVNLYSAQQAKYDRIIEQLNFSESSRVLEIGCGWGGFAAHAAGKTNAKIDAITISKEQYAFAKKKVNDLEIGNLVNIKNTDYRSIRGQYDYIVSIEMFEAVGRSFWKSYFNTLNNNLKPGGKALVQTIVIKDSLFARYKYSTDFIRQYIFPGGALPSRSAFKQAAASSGLVLLGEFSFGNDYSSTLMRWLRKYTASSNLLNKLGFDQKFNRLWEFYLCYCNAGFQIGDLDVIQFKLQKP